MNSISASQHHRKPLSIREAAAIVDSWLAQPAVDLLEPGGATLCTTDRDFTRFDRLKLLDPLLGE